MNSTELPTPVPSKAALWLGRGMSTVPILFLLLDGAMKIVPPQMVIEMTTQLGYSTRVIPWLGIVLVSSSLLAAVPKTAVLGTILLTGYLGGAVATHVRVLNGPFEILFPVIMGALLWGGLVLREPRLAALLPWRKSH